MAVSSLPVQPLQAFYVGATTREPADRFYNVGVQRPGPGLSVAHHARYAMMLVLLESHAADIAVPVRETHAIQLFWGLVYHHRRRDLEVLLNL